VSSETKDIVILSNLIETKSLEYPDLEVLTFVSITEDGYQEEKRTYKSLWENGQRIASSLDEENMARGEAFAIVTLNHPEFVDAMVGSSIAGTVFVPIDPRTKGKKLIYMLTHSQCRGVIIGDYALENLKEIVADCPLLEWIWVVGSESQLSNSPLRTKSINHILSKTVKPMETRVTDPDEPMQMLYTSGTTGDPKAILSPYARFGFVGQLGEVFGLNPDDRPYTGLSLTHANAQLITLGTTLYMGLQGVFSRKFTKSRLWDITRHYGCTTFNLLGGMTTAIYSETPMESDTNNPVRFILSAGMPANIWNAFEKRFDCQIYEFYGAAEGGVLINPPAAGPVGSIGKPPPSLVAKIVDENDMEITDGRAGEIVFQNVDGNCPKVLYHKNKKASDEKTAGGWLRMGDIGHRDENGWYYFHYRKGGGIRHNGDFVNPAFVEKELAEHPMIDDVFVYGVPSTNGVPGEKDVVAAIVAVKNVPFNSDEIFRVCQEKLESNFVPGYIQLVPEIPKTASEKPQERFLLEAFSEESNNIFTAS
jgi:crotonobetaine/carnitine-CoA ligase